MNVPLCLVASLAVLSFAFLACANKHTGGLVHETAPRLSAAELAEAHAAFDVVYDVLQHPRCLNCHPAGDRPLQFEDSRPHVMNVVRGPADRGVAGMLCASCHGTRNPTLDHLPPGVDSGWRLAPREMVFQGRSKAQLAAQLLDPKNSHMTRNELTEHVEHDSLVLWGWDPGPSRAPVPTAHADFVAAFKTWIEAGAPAPPEGN